MSDCQLQNLSPVWLVDDIPAACAYYTNHLGFDLVAMMGEPAQYAILARDGVTISFNKPNEAGARNQVGGLDEAARFADAYIAVTDVLGWYNHLNAIAEVVIEDEPKRYDYGMVDFVVIDPNGYKLCFGQTTEEIATADQLAEGTR